MPSFSLKRPVRKITRRLKNWLNGNSIINFRGQGSINVIDVGSLGNLPEPWLSNARHIQNLLSFEPLEKTGKRRNVIISSNALWSENTIRKFYIYKGFRSSGSSLFEQNFDYVETNFEALKNTGPVYLASTWKERSQLLNVSDIECTTLDTTLEEMDPPIVFDFLKIDAQGAEYEILRGAKRFLSESCIGLHLELFNIPLYKGIKLLPDVKSFLEDMGFSLVLKMPFHGTFNSQNDCIFLRKKVAAEKIKKYELIKKIYKI